ncbi:Plasmid recombination enzyme [Phaeobacter piscinae]|uniref:Plasmid recombination enzyme n=1 Tax=Phaeobacter piscinae TaxID=1580596 RepID=A0ABM6PCH4_9RHOB|nr:plasmid recombination protein [Phaeobacter piscinae]ATG35470.1 Plasmid recombination enzyme [Phaeobacter piscinae]AUQ85990.1 Plasmid recombination enzyme [Phaeobacter piscinae]AUR23874.1 Plasmid recombination enzyme [Phaeobacter piscinae]
MASKKHPIVLRFEGMDPSDIGGYEAHRYRKGGDLGHIDREKPKPRLLIGTDTWAEETLAEIKLMKLETFAAELADLDRRKRRKEIEKRRIEGPRDPWRASRHGPMRELILTANKEWFEQTESSDVEFSTSKEDLFEERAVAWLQEHFGEDVIHARADLDEQAYHIHAVIMPRATAKKYGTECRVLQPSTHPLIKDYEAAQDSVGEWFSEIGLARGQRHKQAIRDALNDGRKPPASPRHVRPAAWRAKQERKLAEKEAALETRKREVVEREEQAEEIIAFGEAVATGAIDEHGQPAVPPQSENAASLTPARKSSLGFAIARRAYRMAMKRLRGKAEAEAERRARAKAAKEVAEIKAADDVIVEIAQQLPGSIRAKIAKVRRKLSAQIMQLDPTTKGRSGGPLSGSNDTR